MEGIYEEIVISEDGTSFEVTVHGVKGSACSHLQDKYLGHGTQTHAQLTAEYYEQPQTVRNQVNVTRR